MGAVIAMASRVLLEYGIAVAGEQALSAYGPPQGGGFPTPGAIVGAVRGALTSKGVLVKRHRRRKALTNDDVRLALTIASSISKKAAETFIAMRVRSR